MQTCYTFEIKVCLQARLQVGDIKRTFKNRSRPRDYVAFVKRLISFDSPVAILRCLHRHVAILLIVFREFLLSQLTAVGRGSGVSKSIELGANCVPLANSCVDSRIFNCSRIEQSHQINSLFKSGIEPNPNKKTCQIR